MILNDFFSTDLKVVNIGLESFSKELKMQGKEVVQVDWKPAAGGDARLQAILERMKKK